MSGEVQASRETAEDGTVTRKGGAQGSVAVSTFESEENSTVDKSRAKTKVAIGENTARGEVEHAKSENGDVHASAKGGTKFTAFRAHDEQVDQEGSSTSRGVVFAQREVSGEGGVDSTSDGTKVGATGKVRNTLIKGGRETVSSDGQTKSSQSATLGEWETSGGGSVEVDDAGTHVKGKYGEKRTMGEYADSHTEDGQTVARSATVGQKSRGAEGGIDMTPESNSIHGSANERQTNFKMARSSTGADGSKTTVGTSIGDSGKEVTGRVTQSADGLHAKGKFVDKSTDIRVDESHTTKGGATVRGEQVWGENVRTMQGEANLDPQLRPTFDGSQENVQTKYRVDGETSTGDVELPGGMKTEVRGKAGVESSQSEKTTIRIDSSGHQVHTTKQEPGQRTYADVKAILKSKDGKVLCVVNVDLQSKVIADLAGATRDKIVSWIEKAKQLANPSSGEAPVEEVLEDEDDAIQDEAPREDAQQTPTRQPVVPFPMFSPLGPMHWQRWRASTQRPGPGQLPMFGGMFSPSVRALLYPHLAQQPQPQSEPQPQHEPAIDDIDEGTAPDPVNEVAQEPVTEPTVDPVVIHTPPEVAPQRASHEPPTQTAPVNPPVWPKPRREPGRITAFADLMRESNTPSNAQLTAPQQSSTNGGGGGGSRPTARRGHITTFSELMAQSSTEDDAGARNVMLQTEHGSRSVTIGGGGVVGGGGKDPSGPDWRASPGRRVGTGAKDRGDRLAVEKARLERMLKRRAEGTPPHGVAKLPQEAEPRPTDPKITAQLEARANRHREILSRRGASAPVEHEAPQGWVGGTGEDGVALGGDPVDQFGVKAALEARAKAKAKEKAKAEEVSAPERQDESDEVTNLDVQLAERRERLAKHHAESTATTTTTDAPTWSGGTGEHGLSIGGEPGDPYGVKQARDAREAARKEKELAEQTTVKDSLATQTPAPIDSSVRDAAKGPEAEKPPSSGEQQLAERRRRMATDQERLSPPSATQGPGRIEHEGWSCYLASILNLFAANPEYLALLNPQTNPPGGDRRRARLQAALGVAARNVRSGELVQADIVLVAMSELADLGMLPGGIRAQQDVGEVLSQILAALDGNDDLRIERSTHTERTDTGTGERTVTDRPMATADTTSHVLTVAARGSRSLNEAIAATYGAVDRPDVRGATIESVDTITTLPSTLTIVIDGATQPLEIDGVVTIPGQAITGGAPHPVQYTVTGFVEHHGGGSGGHYIASVEHDGTWRRNDDLSQEESANQRAPTRGDLRRAKVVTLRRVG